ncbi:MAG: hypothetical protein Q8Q14_03665 [Gemmatimonadales bacterium]|nr:hypothetical protein [Gemmatimonadales bacterium]
MGSARQRWVVANPRGIPQDQACVLAGCERPGIHILRTDAQHWHAGDAIAERDLSAQAFAHYRAGGFIQAAAGE